VDRLREKEGGYKHRHDGQTAAETGSKKVSIGNLEVSRDGAVVEYRIGRRKMEAIELRVSSP
jgi:hypothetical protein